MLREIIFIGYTLEGKRLEGYLIKLGAYYFIQNYVGGNQRVIENTIGQYTGKLDKKGIRIFETDRIFSLKTQFMYDVVFVDSEFALKNKDTNEVLALNSFESEDLLIQNSYS